ncbi:hypothetical protein CC86DRAFT_366355 [Ophiobolus disseminans]|uniref:Zn(2)-C6 fungal-type domain-containing protein n=1 Tax=Ophiobolus disseminans TaxID=1469910 RepID=A0A6A7AJ37_9PLEO|nr:hypothetical protein CC86DRAFT_366355 [Ophiobolus disseminans]
MDPGPPHKRRRPAVACTECRRRKISCDLASPCGPCSKSRSSLKCVYNNDGNGNGNHGAEWASSKPNEPTKALEAHVEQPTILDPMASLGHYIPLHCSEMFGEGMLNLDTISLDAVTSSHAESNENMLDAILGFSHRGLDPKLMTVSPILTATSYPPSSTSNGQMEMGTQPLLPPSTSSSSTTLTERLSTSESGKFEIQPYNLHIRPEGVRSLLHGVAACTRDGLYQLPPGSESVQSLMRTLAKLERTAREVNENKVAFTTWPHRNSALQANSAWDMLPARTQCDTLLDAYFNSFESVLRILHVPSFLQTYEQFWGRARSQWNTADEMFVCTLLVAIALGACVSLGSHVLNDSEKGLQEQAVGWIAYSRDFLPRKMQVAKGAHEDFEIAQLMCLLTLARHTQAQCADAAGSRFMFGDDDLLRIGIRMRLYREPMARGAHGSTKDGEMHRRLWATMLELSLQSCLAEGLPAPIAPDGYDCEPPSNIADENIEGGFDHQCFTPTTILVLLAKTQRLRLRILHLANTPRTPKTSSEAYRIGAELNEACNANTQVLNAMKPSQPTEFQRKLLDMFTRSFVLALHTSFSEKDFNDPASYYSRRMRMEISMLLLCPPASRQGSESPSLTHIPVSGVSGPDTITLHNMSAFHGSSMHVAMGSASGTAPPLLATDAYTSLLVHSNSAGHFVRIQRQMIASLCLDLISELEKNEFPILNQPCLDKIRNVLRVAMHTFESRMRSAAGAHSAREFVVFAAAVAYIDTLGAGGKGMLAGSRQQQDVDETTARAVLSALNAFTEVLHRAELY